MPDNFISQLADDLGLGEEMIQEGQGVYLLPLQDDINIHIALSPQGFTLQSSVVPVPLINREKFLLNVMHANLFGQGTRNGILSLSEDGNVLTLSREVNYTTDYKVFRETLEDFLSVVDVWREEAKLNK